MILRRQCQHIKLSGITSVPDFHLICEGKAIPCHKNILAEQSTVFGALLMSGNEWKENQTGELKINDFCLKTVMSMLEFIYTHQLSEAKGDTVSLLMIADKYDIKSLLERCENELTTVLSLENALDLLELSKRTSAGQLTKSTIHFIGKHDDVIRGQENYHEMTMEDQNWLESQLHVFWQEEISKMEADMVRWDIEIRSLQNAIRELETRH